MSLTHSKSNLIKWSDLPSQADKEKPEMNDKVRIEFLKAVSKKYAEKHK